MATQRYHARQTATETGTDGAGIRDLLTAAGTGSFTTQNVNDTAFQETVRFINNGGTTFATGALTWAGQINVTALGGTIEGRFRFQRRNSSGVVQSSSAYSATFTTTGVKTLSTSWNPGTWVTGDRLCISVEVRRTGGHGNVTLDIGTAGSSYVDAQLAAAPVVDLEDWQFRDHANFENAVNSATFGTTLNTAPTIDSDRGFRLRTVVRETAGGTFEDTLTLQWRKNAGAWSDVTVPTDDGTLGNVAGNSSARDSAGTGTQPVEIRWYTTPSVDGTATTQQIGGGSFIFGTIHDSAITTPSMTLSSVETELEFVLWFHRFSDGSSTPNFVDGDTIEFRLVDGGATPISPAVANPSLTVNIPDHFFGGQVSENPASHSGPIVDANGNLYIVHERAESDPEWFVEKSTDGGLTWTPQDTANEPIIGDLEGLHAFLNGDEIWIFHHGGDDPRMYRFAASNHSTPDVWLDGTGEQIDSAILDVWEQSITAALRSDGTVVCVYSGDTVSPATSYDAWCNIRSAGGTWGTPFAIWQGAEFGGWGVGGGLVDDDFYAVTVDDSGTNDLRGKRITAADALEDWAGTSTTAAAAGTLIDGSVEDGADCRQNWMGPVATSTTSLAIAFVGVDGNGYVRHATNLGTGSLAISARGNAVNSDTIFATGIGNSRQPQGDLGILSNGDLVIVYAKEATQDAATNTLHYRTSDDNGATWGTENSLSTERGWGERIEAIVLNVDSSDVVHVQYADSSLVQQDDYDTTGDPGGYATGNGWHLSIALGSAEVFAAASLNNASQLALTASAIRAIATAANNAATAVASMLRRRQASTSANNASSASVVAVTTKRVAVSVNSASSSATAALRKTAISTSADNATDIAITASKQALVQASANQASAATASVTRTRQSATSVDSATTIAAAASGQVSVAGSANSANTASVSVIVKRQSATSLNQATTASATIQRTSNAPVSINAASGITAAVTQGATVTAAVSVNQATTASATATRRSLAPTSINSASTVVARPTRTLSVAVSVPTATQATISPVRRAQVTTSTNSAQTATASASASRPVAVSVDNASGAAINAITQGTVQASVPITARLSVSAGVRTAVAVTIQSASSSSADTTRLRSVSGVASSAASASTSVSPRRQVQSSIDSASSSSVSVTRIVSASTSINTASSIAAATATENVVTAAASINVASQSALSSRVRANARVSLNSATTVTPSAVLSGDVSVSVPNASSVSVSAASTRSVTASANNANSASCRVIVRRSSSASLNTSTTVTPSTQRRSLISTSCNTASSANHSVRRRRLGVSTSSTACGVSPRSSVLRQISTSVDSSVGFFINTTGIQLARLSISSATALSLEATNLPFISDISGIRRPSQTTRTYTPATRSPSYNPSAPTEDGGEGGTEFS